MSFVLYLTNSIGPTSVGVNTFSTIVLLTLITNCNGGALLATQHTHFCLILCLILHGGQVALVSPNMRRDMLPWSVGGVTDLPTDAKLCKTPTQARAGQTFPLRASLRSHPAPHPGPPATAHLRLPALLGVYIRWSKSVHSVATLKTPTPRGSACPTLPQPPQIQGWQCYHAHGGHRPFPARY